MSDTRNCPSGAHQRPLFAHREQDPRSPIGPSPTDGCAPPRCCSAIASPAGLRGDLRRGARWPRRRRRFGGAARKAPAPSRRSAAATRPLLAIQGACRVPRSAPGRSAARRRRVSRRPAIQGTCRVPRSPPARSAARRRRLPRHPRSRHPPPRRSRSVPVVAAVRVAGQPPQGAPHLLRRPARLGGSRLPRSAPGSPCGARAARRTPQESAPAGVPASAPTAVEEACTPQDVADRSDAGEVHPPRPTL